MSRWSRPAFVGALSFLGSATAANAHIIGARLGDFYAGAVHPLTDLRDVLLWIALGLLAGSLGASRARLVLLLFPLGLAAGSGMGMALRPTSDSPLAAAGALLVIGLLLAIELRIHGALLCVVAFGVAAMRGAASADGAGVETNRLLFTLGLTVAGYVVIALVMAATLAFRDDEGRSPGWRRIAVRAVGSWIAAIGLMMSGLAFAS
jgi:hydrogenase/urease accessory protein HupE